MKQQTYEIKYVNQFKVDKNNLPYKDKNGNPFVRVSIKVPEYGEQYISGFWWGSDCPWKANDKIDLVISEKEYNGKKSLGFDIPKKEDKSLAEIQKLSAEINELRIDVKRLIKHFTGEETLNLNSDGTEQPLF